MQSKSSCSKPEAIQKGEAVLLTLGFLPFAGTQSRERQTIALQQAGVLCPPRLQSGTHTDCAAAAAHGAQPQRRPAEAALCLECIAAAKAWGLLHHPETQGLAGAGNTRPILGYKAHTLALGVLRCPRPCPGQMLLSLKREEQIQRGSSQWMGQKDRPI